MNRKENRCLTFKPYTLTALFPPSHLKKRLDSNSNSIIIGASLDERFAKNLTDVCYSLKKKYPLTLIGMPNWDGFKFFMKEDSYKDFPIHFTTPYYNQKTTLLSNYLIAEYDSAL